MNRSGKCPQFEKLFTCIQQIETTLLLAIISSPQVPIGSAQPSKRFPYTLISNMIQDFLSSRLKGLHYDAPHEGILAKVLSDEVKSQVRAVCPARYKLVCIVTLGQLELEGQQGDGGLLLASRCLWDPYTDT